MAERNTDIVSLLRKQLPGIIGVYAFGSQGTAHERPDSDIDLAVLLQSPAESAQLWEIAQDIAMAMGKDVDLLDLLQASTVMRFQVISTGQRLYCSDRMACERFEDYVYAAYARLNEERRGIMEDIQQRGSIYG